MPTTLLAPSLYQLETPATYNTFTTIQDISTPTNGQAFVLQPNQLNVGQSLSLRAAGVFSTTGTPNLTLSFYFGGAAGVILAATAATATASGASNLMWMMEWEGTVTATGASGTIIGEGFALLGTTATAATLIPIPNATPQTALTINTQLPKSVGVAGTWSASSISNTITVQTFRVALWN